MLNRYLLAPLTALLLLAAPRFAQAQSGGVGIGTTAPDASAALDIVSSSKGLLLPRVAAATSIASPAPGLLVYQTGVPAGFYYNAGTAAAPSWQQLATAGSGDNLGNHTATTNIGLNGNWLSNAPGTANGLRVDNAGNVGIGIGAPLSRLSIGQVTAQGNTVGQNLGELSFVGFNRPQPSASIQALTKDYDDTGLLLFKTSPNGLGAVERMRITADGQMGIGTPGPTQMLDVNGGLRVRGLAGTDARLPVVAADGTFGVSAPLYSASPAALPTGVTGTAGTNSYSGPWDVAMSGNLAYLICLDNSLQVFDVANPSAPVRLARVMTAGTLTNNPYAIVVSGTTLYITNAKNHTVQLFSVANPNAPVLLSTLTIPGGGYTPHIAVSGTKAYVADYSNARFYVIDISNPSAPTIAGSIATAFYPNEVAVKGSYAYLNTYDGLTIVNVANPSAPVEVSRTQRGLRGPMVVQGNTLFAMSSTQGLTTFDLSNPTAPAQLGTISRGGDWLSVSGNVVCMTSSSNTSNTLEVVDATTPASMRALASLPINGQAGGVAISGTTATVAGYNANSVQVFAGLGLTRTVALNPDGTLTSVPTIGLNDVIQNQTNLTQAANFIIAGTGAAGTVQARGTNLITSQGAYLQWNRLGGVGETWLLNQKGLGAGGIFFGASDAVSTGSNTITEWARFDASGRLGIGTNNPGHPLTVQAGGASNSPLLGFYSQAGADMFNFSLAGGGLNLSESGVAAGRLFVKPGGNVGIGTTNPIAPLHVNGTASALTKGGGGYSYYNPGSTMGTASLPGNQGKAVAAYFEGGEVWVNGWIVAGALQTTSDRRIKRVIGLSNRKADLALLQRLRITDYTYIDQVNNTPGVIKKVIAQEVEELLPTAVSRSTQALPNVYGKATKLSYANGQLTVTMAKPHELPATSGRMRFYTPANESLDPEVTVVDAHTVRFACADAHAAGLFVYGKYVNDFRSVDYDALTTLNVSATQELARKVAALEAENNALKTQAATDKAQATATLETFEARLRRLEAVTGGQAQH
jgi:hypothetical protein